jgi:hypothetical protein
MVGRAAAQSRHIRLDGALAPGLDRVYLVIGEAI